MANRAFLFPGQGSQYVGMTEKLKQFPEAMKFVSRANDILGFDIASLMENGPADELKQTENTQPALVATSCAWLSVIKGKGTKCDIALGHSLGEYSALYCAGAMSFETTLKLVRRRGELMRGATSSIPGTMGAIIRLDKSKIEDICKKASELGVCEPANFNSSEQIVVSGETDAVGKAMKLAKEAGARMARLLPVSAPFHSSLMNPVADEFAKNINSADIIDAEIPVISNCNAKPVQKAGDIRENLIKQINSPVLWEKSILVAISQGTDYFLEVGAKNVLTGLNKRIVPNLTTENVETIFSD